MKKTIIVALAAIGIYAKYTECGTNAFVAVALSLGMACCVCYSYNSIENMERKYAERERKRCQRERVTNATDFGKYQNKRTSNRDTYARYAKGNSEEKTNVSNITMVAGKGNCGSSTVSKKPIRKVCGALSYDYYRNRSEQENEFNNNNYRYNVNI